MRKRENTERDRHNKKRTLSEGKQGTGEGAGAGLARYNHGSLFLGRRWSSKRGRELENQADREESRGVKVL